MDECGHPWVWPRFLYICLNNFEFWVQRFNWKWSTCITSILYIFLPLPLPPPQISVKAYSWAQLIEMIWQILCYYYLLFLADPIDTPLIVSRLVLFGRPKEYLRFRLFKACNISLALKLANTSIIRPLLKESKALFKIDLKIQNKYQN